MPSLFRHLYCVTCDFLFARNSLGFFRSLSRSSPFFNGRVCSRFKATGQKVKARAHTSAGRLIFSIFLPTYRSIRSGFTCRRLKIYYELIFRQILKIYIKAAARVSLISCICTPSKWSRLCMYIVVFDWWFMCFHLGSLERIYEIPLNRLCFVAFTWIWFSREKKFAPALPVTDS